jgi:hypothetical protein
MRATIVAKWEADGLNAESDGVDPIQESDDAPEDTTDDSPEADAITHIEDSRITETADEPAVETAEEAAPEPEPVTEEVAKVETPAEAVADTSKEEQDELAAMLGLGKPPDDPKKRAGWWKTRLAYSQVAKAHKEILKKAQDTHEMTLKERIAEYEPFKTRDVERQQAEARIANEPEFFLPMLARLYPDKYGKLLAPILNAQPTLQNAVATLPQADDDNPMPEPNVPLEGGGSTYDVEGLKRFAKWVQKETTKTIRNDLKPQLEFLNTTKEQQQKAVELQQIETRTQEAAKAAVAEVMTWKGGEANLKEIIAVANTYPENYDPLKAMSLAYNKVVLPKMEKELTISMEDMRKKVLEENKKKSVAKTSTAVQPAIRSSVVTDKPKMTTRDIIMAHAKKLGA